MRIIHAGILTAALIVLAPGAAYAALGAVRWEAVYSSRGGYDNDYARGLAMSARGELAVAGHVTEKDGNNNYLLIKYGTYGAAEWAREFDHSWYDVGRAAAFDPDGNIVVAGESYDLENPRDSYSGAFFTEFRVVRYSPAGDVLQEMAASGYHKDNEPAGVVCDGEGDVYVTGTAKNASGTAPLFYTVKFDAAGSIAWEKVEDWGGDSYATGIRLAPDGTPVLTGYYKDANDTYNIRVLRYDPATGRKLMDIFYNNQSDDEKAWGVAVDREGDIIVTGETSADDGVTLTLKYSPKGELLWARRYKYTEYKNRGNAVAVDAQGRIYIAGRTIKPESGGDWLLLIYDKDGRLVYDRAYPFGGNDSAEDIAVDVYGNVVITGTTQLPDQPAIARTMRVEGFPALQGRSEPGGRGPGLSPLPLPAAAEYRSTFIGRSTAHRWGDVRDYLKNGFLVFHPAPAGGGAQRDAMGDGPAAGEGGAY